MSFERDGPTRLTPIDKSDDDSFDLHDTEIQIEQTEEGDREAAGRKHCERGDCEQEKKCLRLKDGHLRSTSDARRDCGLTRRVETTRRMRRESISGIRINLRNRLSVSDLRSSLAWPINNTKSRQCYASKVLSYAFNRRNSQSLRLTPAHSRDSKQNSLNEFSERGKKA